MTGDSALGGTLEALRSALDEIGAPAMIIGGIAVIARGVPRQTIDVDATVWGADLEIERALEVLERYGIEPRIRDAADFARERQILLLHHVASKTPIDLSLAWLPFEREALEKSTEVDFGGISLRIARPEDLVILKAVAWRDRDRSDIERLLVLYGQEIDLGRVRRIVAEFADVLEDPQRSRELEELIRRVEGRRG